MSCECERLAEAIYREIEKQLPDRGGDFDNRDLQSVLIDGQLDLLKIAASLTRRFCVLADNLETVITDGSAASERDFRRVADRA
ncbi:MULTISPECIES: hypothetical protein [unclassified Bosea (in: a-proteobacteria)]|uniref:hypothetical protein n=1 Tax=unclassified Bosea (in: a-proteobacteria) TaxID=2653178 RepID=UPI000F7611BD|nr:MULTISPECIES: hypothetical protein [unclassified Bosea (in: a-proteobacteria)]AZO81888.1 hypothetical protein BLM15_29155 [Bosea sp. Tri-49]RXT16804.1 hypothetical protein B5U98_26955 [Bosea sp. Tri-39]RXT37708.1 hypothetical protein B5U99_12230 [Bosea sp. Tri-54]